jgi:spoIIIJ-associated protein
MVAESHASGAGTGESGQGQEGVEDLLFVARLLGSADGTGGDGIVDSMAHELIRDGKLDTPAAADALREFLEQIVRTSGFQLKVAVHTAVAEAASDAEVIADIDGKDRELLLERGAEVLKAMEHLAFRALRLEPAFHEKIHVDCGGYRALRFEELRMTARVAAERVQTSKQAFKLNPMSSRERRIVHLTLKEIPGIRTESVGMGEERQVVIHPAESKPSR